MSEIDLSDVVSDPALADAFIIERSQGGFVAGGWSNSVDRIPAFGVVSVANQDELQMIPEADRITGARVFHSTQEMFVTGADRNGLSDVLIFEDVKYRVYNVFGYGNRGYFKALAARMVGD